MGRPKKRGEKKDDLVSVQMAPSMKKAIERKAQTAEVSVSHWCRGVLKEELAKPPKPEAPIEEVRT